MANKTPAPHHRTRAERPDQRASETTSAKPGAAEETYTVGYKQPPKHTQFKPGQSGNPAGRPKGAKNLKTLVGRELRQKVVVRENGRSRTVSKVAVVAMQLVKRAMEGDHRAILTLLKHDESLEAELKVAAEAERAATAQDRLDENDAAILADFETEIAERIRRDLETPDRSQTINDGKVDNQ